MSCVLSSLSLTGRKPRIKRRIACLLQFAPKIIPEFVFLASCGSPAPCSRSIPGMQNARCSWNWDGGKSHFISPLEALGEDVPWEWEAGIAWDTEVAEIWEPSGKQSCFSPTPDRQGSHCRTRVQAKELAQLRAQGILAAQGAEGLGQEKELLGGCSVCSSKPLECPEIHPSSWKRALGAACLWGKGRL